VFDKLKTELTINEDDFKALKPKKKLKAFEKVEFIKEEQGGIEEFFGQFSTGQWLSIPFILVGLYYLFMAEKPLPEDIDV
jgi:hypothetical protein